MPVSAVSPSTGPAEEGLVQTNCDLISASQYMKRVYKKDGERVFARARSEWTKGMASN